MDMFQDEKQRHLGILERNHGDAVRPGMRTSARSWLSGGGDMRDLDAACPQKHEQ